MRRMTRRNFLWNSSRAAGLTKFGTSFNLWPAPSQPVSKPYVFGPDTTFFVATNGNDAWTGKIEEPNVLRTDGPFATLTRARDAIRQLKSQQSITGPIKVMVRSGKYYLDRTLKLGPEDSGSRKFPITYRAYGEEKVVLSGGQKVTSWRPYRGSIVQSELPGTKGCEWKFRQLFLNGKRQIRARYPKFEPSDPLYGGWLFTTGPAEPGSQNSFTYKPGTFNHRWAKPTQGEVVVFPGAGWNDTIAAIKAIDETKHIIALARDIRNQDRPPWFAPFPLLAGSRFRVENLLEELEQPGEWCLDSEAGIIYFWPPSGSITSADEIVVPALETLISARGTSWIVISGFIFTETTGGEDMHRDGLDGYGAQFLNQGYRYCGEAVHLRETEHCTIENNLFYAVGGNAIYLERFNSRNVIRRNEISHAGANGVCLLGNYVRVNAASGSLSEGKRQLLPMFNEVLDNYIHHCGMLNKYVAGVFLGVSDGNLIAHNRIEYLPHHAINLGLNGFGRNVVEYNEIRQVCLELADTGAINSWMDNEASEIRVGHVIRFNLIVDVPGCMTDHTGRIVTPDGNAHGIYLDNNSSNNFVYGNIIVRPSATGIVIHGGQNNFLENNIIVDAGTRGPSGGARQVAYWPASAPSFLTGNRFCRNIVYHGKCDVPLVLFDFQLDPPWIGKEDKAVVLEDQIVAESSRNIFFRTDGGEFLVGRLAMEATPGTREISLSEWQYLGYDTDSEISSPMFLDPSKDDYRLRPDSPALRLGFVPIDMAQIGPRNADRGDGGVSH